MIKDIGVVCKLCNSMMCRGHYGACSCNSVAFEHLKDNKYALYSNSEKFYDIYVVYFNFDGQIVKIEDTFFKDNGLDVIVDKSVDKDYLTELEEVFRDV